MPDDTGPSRRRLMAAGLAAAGAAAMDARAADPPARAPRRARPLAQHGVVVTTTPDKGICTCGPGLVKLADGMLFATVPFWARATKRHRTEVRTARSTDGGQSWTPLEPLPYFTATPWVHNGALYLFAHRVGKRYRNDDLVLLRSGDGGRTWSEPITLFKGHYWNCPTGMVVKDGRVYRAFDQLDVRGRAERVVAGDLGADLMDPGSWRISNPAAFPGVPEALMRPGTPRKSRWLEPNVVNVRGRMILISRVEVAAMTTASIAGVCDLADDGNTLRLAFTQFYPIPGGQNKLHIVHDRVAGLFWTPATLVTDSQDHVGYCKRARQRRVFTGTGGNERRILMLLYSIDALNWFQAGCIAVAPRLRQSFMYACPLIDGQDMLILSRTSRDGRDQHDADLCTFHRVRNFRSLALDLYPKA